jgi:hypothetical protein
VLSLQGLREITARTATLFDHVLGLKPDMDIAVKGADSI